MRRGVFLGGAFACPARGRPFAPRAAACPAPFPLNHSFPHLRAIAQGTYSPSTGSTSSAACQSCAAVRLHAQRVDALSLPAQQPAPPRSPLTILPRTSASHHCAGQVQTKHWQHVLRRVPVLRGGALAFPACGRPFAPRAGSLPRPLPL
jgi:hypothetical protein